MALSLDLNKAAAKLSLDLTKKGVDMTQISAEVSFCLDVSGSYQDEQEDGSTQKLLERLVPWSMVLDPDKQMDVFTFSNGEENAHHAGMITPQTVDGFIRRSVIGRVPGYGGGTDYSYVLEKNLQHFGWLPKASAEAPKKGMFGGLFGGSKPASQVAVAKRRSLVIFNTDGDNNDKSRVTRVLEESERRGDLVYFLFIAYANGGGKFPFLQEIGDRFSNTGLVVINDINRWCAQPDDVINEQLIGDELVAWLKK